MYTQKFHIYNFHSISLWIFSQCLKHDPYNIIIHRQKKQQQNWKIQQKKGRKNFFLFLFHRIECVFSHTPQTLQKTPPNIIPYPILLKHQKKIQNSLSLIYNTSIYGIVENAMIIRSTSAQQNTIKKKSCENPPKISGNTLSSV